MLLGLVYVYIYGSICSLGKKAYLKVNLVSDNYSNEMFKSNFYYNSSKCSIVMLSIDFNPDVCLVDRYTTFTMLHYACRKS